MKESLLLFESECTGQNNVNTEKESHYESYLTNQSEKKSIKARSPLGE